MIWQAWAGIAMFALAVVGNVIVTRRANRARADHLRAAKAQADATAAKFSALFEEERQNRAEFRSWWESQDQPKEPWE